MSHDDKRTDHLLEILWLLQIAKPLKKYYEDVKVEMVMGDEYEPMIVIHGIPIDVDEVEELSAILPDELEAAKQELLDKWMAQVDGACVALRNNVEENNGR